MVIDTFTFFNELDLLDIRLNTLDRAVDRFVLVEGTRTFQGAPKPLYFQQHRDRYAAFLDRIVHVVVDDWPADADAWAREHFQRDAILRGLTDSAAEDVVLVSDVDEIPDPRAIPRALEPGQRILFRQRLFYFRLNNACVELPDLPWSCAVRHGELGSPAQLRREVVKRQSLLLAGAHADAPADELRPQGGWHFSYLGDAHQMIEKLEAFSHTEFNTSRFKDPEAIDQALHAGRDPLGRDLSFEVIADDELPGYVREHREALEARGLLAPAGGFETARHMLFDQYSRYRACAEIARKAGMRAGDQVLDIGSGPECLFRHFVPDVALTCVDPLIVADAQQGRVRGDAYSAALDARAWDVVTAVDVLEHVPAGERERFLDRLCALSSRLLVIGFPCRDESDAERVDAAVESAWRDLYGHEYPWLQEHHQFGLPSAAQTVQLLTARGWNTRLVGHGHAPWLRRLLPFIISIWEIEELHPLAREISARFNRSLYAHDFRGPYYRQFLIASRAQVPAIEVAGAQNTSCAAAADTVFDQLLSRAQDGYFTASLRLLKDRKLQIERIEADRRAAEAQRVRVQSEAEATSGALRAQLTALQSTFESMRSSRSWRITAPLRFVARLKRYGLIPEDRQKLVRLARKVWHRTPLPEPVRDWIRDAWRALRRWQSRRAAAVTPRVPAQRPALRDPDRRDFIVFGVIDWHFRQQRPQHLARGIAAAGHRVFYVSAQLEDGPGPGLSAEQLDDAGRLFQVKLRVPGAPTIYRQAPDAATLARLCASAGELLEWADVRQAVCVVQHAYWHALAAVVPDSILAYDCMDHHEGFGNNDPSILALERALLGMADLTVVTSAWLADAVGSKAARCSIVRNAGDYDHFAARPPEVFADPQGRRVIGYVGAIADWFDLDLVEQIARRFAHCLVLLVGNDSVGAAARLRALPNVQFTGEVPYARLPYYVHGFDVCLLPFRVLPLTLATNPVKVYEYLAAGRPVVASALPEIAQFGSLVEAAPDHPAFLDAVERALASGPQEGRQARQAYAREQTWSARAAQFLHLLQPPPPGPLASVVVVTYNNLALTQACLASLDRYTDHAPVELIVVDNASSDGTPEFLRQWEREAPGRRIVLNEDNRGFAAANNQGLAVAQGEFLVLLNNDTQVTPGWLRTLVRHLRRDESIGLLGPVTNNIGNEARIDIAYDDMEQMLERSAAFTRRRIGSVFDLRTVAFFCVAMRRSVFEQVGPLDEAFGRGFFEDDDYCRRVEQRGLRIACAEDVFVHHHLSASFNQLKQQERQALFEQNKAVYEAKWGPWQPHEYRQPRGLPAAQAAAVPAPYEGQAFLVGRCNVCGQRTRFFYPDESLWREALNCEHCRTTSRYRSIAKGLLTAIAQLQGVQAPSLAQLPRSAPDGASRLRVYDTQPPFDYQACAYPLPRLLQQAGWIDVLVSQYDPRLPLGKTVRAGVTNQNLESLTYDDASLDIVVTSDVMEHVRLDDAAHREIHRVLRPGGVYLFTVPHDMGMERTLTRVQVVDTADASRDALLMEPEYHGDVNGDGSGVLSYRVYGQDLLARLREIGFDVDYARESDRATGILNCELFYCRKR